MKHISKLYKSGTTQISELKQAERMRELITGEWDAPHEIHQTHLPGLEKAEREVLIGIINQWIGILEDENKEGAE